jgi:circadian clock protein KaiC
MTRADAAGVPLAPTGIAGLDTLLGGGLPIGFAYAVQGEPGVGKTTLGLQFLRTGLGRDERVLYLTLSHSRRDLDVIARSHGWSLDGMKVHEFSAAEVSDRLAREQTVFPPDEVDSEELADPLLQAIADAAPQRIVVDAVEQLRLLSERPQRYRRQLLLLRRALEEAPDATTLYLADLPSPHTDRELEAMAHGVLRLERFVGRHGGVVRRLEVTKGRGMVFHGGLHPFRILTGGLDVYPVRRSDEAQGHDDWRTVSTGLAGLDELLGGGLETGTSCLLLGAVGTGKSAVAARCAISAAERGDRVAVFLTEEREATYLRRAASLGMDAAEHVAEGRLVLERVQGDALPHGEFAHRVHRAVDEGAQVVVLDSLTGYLDAVEERDLASRFAELLRELGDRGVLTLLLMTEHGLIGGGGGAVGLDLGHLSDTVVLFRRFEAGSDLRRAVSVIKKRHGAHAPSVRELVIEPGSLSLVPAMTHDAVRGGTLARGGTPAPAAEPLTGHGG